MTTKNATTKTATTGGRHVALLRGINVGGKNKLPMRELAALFEESGCRDVTTYIQSGNVVFTPPARGQATLARTLQQRIADEFSLRVPVVLRTAGELATVAGANPFLARKLDPATLHVIFLADAPSAKAVAALDPERSPPDQFSVAGRDIYVCCPNGVARSKLTNDYFDRTLATISTGRNWRTVMTLVEMARG
jgi:uncharacterized protein (DUF1697 family)